MSGALVTSAWGTPDGNEMNLDALPSSTSERIDPFGLTRMIGRAITRSLAEHGEYDELTGTELKAPEETVDPDTLNKKWGVVGPTPGLSLKFDSALPESVAISMNSAKRDEIARANAAQRSPGTWGATLADLGYGFLDPIGLAASVLPVAGEARMAAMLGRAGVQFGAGIGGRTALRAVSGAADASVANLPLVGIRYGLSQQEQADYGMADAAKDMAYGALLGSVLHPVFGALKDWVGRASPAQALASDPVLDTAAMHAATAAVVEGRPVEVAPFADIAASRVATSRRELLGSTALTPGGEGRPSIIPSAESGVEDWQTANRNAAVSLADRLGVTQQIAELANAGKTAKEISAALGGRLDVGEVRAVRDHLGIEPAGPMVTPGGAVIPNESASAPKQQRPVSLLEFLARRGGVVDEGGDIASMGGDTWHRGKVGMPRLIKPSEPAEKGAALPGMTEVNGRVERNSLDYSAQAAHEEGYLPNADPNTLLDAMHRELHGKPVYKPEIAALVDAQRGAAADEDTTWAARETVRDVASEAGISLKPEDIDHAVSLVLQGWHPEDAVMDTARGGENEALDALYSSESAQQARGKLPPEEATTLQQADDAAKAKPVPTGKVTPELTQALADAELQIAQARDAGVLSEADEAELRALDEAMGTAQNEQSAILQAAACLVRGMI